MTYKEIQKALKAFKEQGLTNIALNAKKDILAFEYNRIMNAIVKEAINSEPEIEVNEDTNKVIQDIEVTEDLTIEVIEDVKEVSALEILEDKSEDLINEAVTNPPLELTEDSSGAQRAFGIELSAMSHEVIPPEIKEAPISQITPEIKELSIDEYTVKSNDNEAFEDLTELNINPLVSEQSEPNLFDKKVIEALVNLIIIFVSSIVKLWCKVNRISQLSKAILGKVKEARADIKSYWQWFIKGFTLPSFV